MSLVTLLQYSHAHYVQFPYACVGQFSFLQLSIASSPIYPEILRRVKEGDKLLDLGCAFGQELRRLVRSPLWNFLEK
jgi:cyclopropane fatty-acyl-phospholipid synthase-like methyltransferase